MFPKLARSMCALFVGSCVLISVSWANEDVEKTDTQSTTLTEEMQCKVVFLKHVSCKAAAIQVRALFQCEDEPAKATWLTEPNAVLLRSTPEEVRQMEYLLAQVDVPQAELGMDKQPEYKLRIHTIQYAEADELANVLAHVLESSSSRFRQSNSTTPVLHVSIDKRTNVILLRGTEEQLASAAELIKALDIPVAPAQQASGATTKTTSERSTD